MACFAASPAPQANAFQASENDFVYVAERASISFNRQHWLEDTNVADTAMSMLDLKKTVDKLRDVQAKDSGLLGDASGDIATAMPLLHKVYIYFKANNFDGLPLAMISRMMMQNSFQRDMSNYEARSQRAAFKLVDYLQERTPDCKSTAEGN